MNRVNRFKARIFLLVVAVLVIFVPFSHGAENVLGLDAKGSYDIYVGYEDNSLSVIKNVTIVGLRDIKGVNFLVIQTDTFDSKRSEGLIQFSFVRAVLPSYRAVNLPVTGEMPYKNR